MQRGFLLQTTIWALSVAVSAFCTYILSYRGEIIKEMILIAITTFLKALINDFLDNIYMSIFITDSISTTFE